MKLKQLFCGISNRVMSSTFYDHNNILKGMQSDSNMELKAAFRMKITATLLST